MRLRSALAALLGPTVLVAAILQTTSTAGLAATVITTNAVRVTLDLRDQIDGLTEVAVTITCAPVNILPPTDTETTRLIPDVPTQDLRFPAFTATTTCKIDVTVTSDPAVGGLAINVNGSVVAGPVVAQQLSVSGVVPGQAPIVKIVLSRSPLPSTSSSVATSRTTTTAPTLSAAATTTTVAATTTTTLANSFTAPPADASAQGSVASTVPTTVTPTALNTTTTISGPAVTVTPVVARVLAVAVARPIVAATTTSSVARIGKPTTTVKRPVLRKATKPAKKLATNVKTTTTARAKTNATH